jgi:hypothetical protein
MNDHDNAYTGLIEAEDDARWAFGTSFDDPLAGVDTTLPADVDGAALAAYCLMLGDDALVSAQRLAEWSTHAPELEEEVALANIGLDLLGQARLLLARAAAADFHVVPALPEGSPVPAEDALAFFRDEHAYRNVRLTEQDNGDFARSMARLLVFSTWRLAVLQRLTASRDAVLAAVASKGVKELTYHRDYAARWRSCRSSPVLTRWAGGRRAGHRLAARARLRSRRVGHRPRAAGAHAGRPRRPARRRHRRRHRGRDDHADLLRLPGHGDHACGPNDRPSARRHS